ncbi:cuticle collagen 8-like [Balaenoptera ricei]|uniref:cuticle collagen 8-like n=1 Tax=Balaenoptera ricei TaxID=2746895 RepID=UPI0028BDCE21|nr:cuticle collagen 8-like [Balaenoptera ricei]
MAGPGCPPPPSRAGEGGRSGGHTESGSRGGPPAPPAVTIARLHAAAAAADDDDRPNRPRPPQPAAAPNPAASPEGALPGPARGPPVRAPVLRACLARPGPRALLGQNGRGFPAQATRARPPLCRARKGSPAPGTAEGGQAERSSYSLLISPATKSDVAASGSHPKQQVIEDKFLMWDNLGSCDTARVRPGISLPGISTEMTLCPGTMLHAVDTVMNKTELIPVLREFSFLLGDGQDQTKPNQT